MAFINVPGQPIYNSVADLPASAQAGQLATLISGAIYTYASGAWTLQSTGGAGAGITALTGDVTATGPGSTAATVALVAGSTAANVHAAELLTNAATAVNTASTIMKRDGSGQVAATTFTGALTGHASLDIAATSLTANGDLLTRTAGVPAPLAVGTNGQLLVIAGGVPSWQNNPNPSNYSFLYDDFLSGVNAPIGNIGWQDTSTGGTAANYTNVSTNIDTNHPGIIRIKAGTTNTGNVSLSLSANSGAVGNGYVLGTNPRIEEWCFYLVNLSTVSEEYKTTYGSGRHTNNIAQTNGVYWLYDRLTSVNWQLVSAKASSLTTVDTGIPVVAGAWTKLKTVATSAVITGYINDVAVVTTISTNIPILNICPSFKITKTAGTSDVAISDMDFFMSQGIVTR